MACRGHDNDAVAAAELIAERGDPSESKEEFSRKLTRGGSREDIPIYRQPDTGDSQVGRCRHTRTAAFPHARNLMHLSLLSRIRWGS